MTGEPTCAQPSTKAKLHRASTGSLDGAKHAASSATHKAGNAIVHKTSIVTHAAAHFESKMEHVAVDVTLAAVKGKNKMHEQHEIDDIDASRRAELQREITEQGVDPAHFLRCITKLQRAYRLQTFVYKNFGRAAARRSPAPPVRVRRVAKSASSRGPRS